MLRRDLLVMLLASLPLAALPASLFSAEPAPARRPNIVIVVADDMGWRDTGYQGSPWAITPNLDDMAAQGVRFDYHYAAGTVCCPNRYSILTGRTPSRAGWVHLGTQASGKPQPPERWLPVMLKQAGYRAGHFGKTHKIDLAGFDKVVSSMNYFDVGGTLGVSENGADKGTIKLPDGVDSSVALMDLAIPWIKDVATGEAPFFAHICFGAPHNPQIGAQDFKDLYKDKKPPHLDRCAEISGLDAAVGKLRKALRELQIADNTLLWFTSDNGAGGGLSGRGVDGSMEPSQVGKYDIGSRTVACLEWPARVKQPLRTSVPTVHTDIVPTVLAAANVPYPDKRPLDGIDLLPLLDGRMKERPQAIGFMEWRETAGKRLVDIDFVTGTEAKWVDGRHMLVVNQPGRAPSKPGIPDGLYDIYADEAMQRDLTAALPEGAVAMRTVLDAWRKGVRASYEGLDLVGR